MEAIPNPSIPRGRTVADQPVHVTLEKIRELVLALRMAREYVLRVDGTMSFVAPEKRLTHPDVVQIDKALAHWDGVI